MSKEEIKPLISAELEKELNSCTHLPSLPAVALKIIDATKDPDITLQEVTDIISSDPAISVKLLKTANSPLYSQRRTLNNLRDALTLLGFNASLTIALSFSLFQSIGSTTNHKNYWKRSILSASIARLLGAHLGVNRLEDLFLASLLQDIGILVIQCMENSPYTNDENSNLKHSECTQLEKEKLGVEHSVVGAWFLQSWQLPEYLTRSVMFSHSLNINEEVQNEKYDHFHFCVSLSGNLADIWLDGNPDELLPSILDVAKGVLNIDNDKLNQLVLEINDSLPEISSIFDMSLVDENERENVVNEARELLLERSLHTIKKSEGDRRYIDGITNKIEQIEKTSRLDHLTKVYNRQHIEELLEKEHKEANINRLPLSLAFIDIDNFKIINDTYGHLIGDEVLKSISDFFSKNIRETDTFARFGGDEFLLMLPDSPADISKKVLERLLASFNGKVSVNVKGERLTTFVSIGLATHRDKHEFLNIKEFMAAADEALYKAKEKGKNCLVVF